MLVVGYVADADAFAAASDHVVLEVCDVVDADTVVISVIRADEGNAVVATVAAGGAASLKAPDGVRSTAAPWPTTLRAWRSATSLPPQ